MSTQDIVKKLWNLCNVLRDDGITYHQYVTELTYLLFLKMAEETDREKEIPQGYRWQDLAVLKGREQLDFYRSQLIHLGQYGSERCKAIFHNAATSLRLPTNLSRLVSEIDKLEWYDAREEGLGNLYEGLLEKNATETKSGAGQYFTPRPLIDSMTHLIQPQAGELVQDPAAGTGGFLIAALKYVCDHTGDLFDLPQHMRDAQRSKYCAMELVPDTHRLLLMNAMLHDLQVAGLMMGDTLSARGKDLPKAQVILTNPPFGTKKGSNVKRDDFTFPTNNKQLAFVEHIYRALIPGSGRAAVVVPDNVLFDTKGTDIRTDLMAKCDLHTILRLPTGIFYAQGVKTNVLFFNRGTTDTDNTADVWIYDMRHGMPKFGKRTPFTRAHFADFEAAYGPDKYGKAPRQESERFRRFSRQQILDRGENLDISWLGQEEQSSKANLDVTQLADEILNLVNEIASEVESIKIELEVE